MKPSEVLYGKFITAVCCKPELETKTIKVTNRNGTIITKNFFVSYSKPCFSNAQTCFINFTDNLVIDTSSEIDFI